MKTNKQSKRDNIDTNFKHRKKILGLSIAAVLAIATISTVVYIQAQSESLGQLANSLTPIQPEIKIVKQKLSSVDGIAITEIANNTKSDSLQRMSNSTSKTIYKDGLAEMTLSKGLTPDGQDIIVATVTNTGSEKFYIKEFGLGGETATGIATLEAPAIDADYSKAVYGNHPKPARIELVILKPGESLSMYIEGKWTVSATNQPITKFGGGVLFFYDKESPNFNNGFNWSIGI